MKIITKNLGLYAGLLLAYTVLFRFGLSSLLTAEKWLWVTLIAVFYGAIIFVTAWMTGRRDGKENFLLLHFILFLVLRRRTIKGVHKTDIFE